jgi:hypothetical protein
MRPIVFATLTLAVALALPTAASAGRIFGDLSLGGKPVPAGVKIRVTRPGASAVADTTTTDKVGSYKLMVKEEGKATLTVLWEGKPVEFAVFSNKEAMRYDLVLEKKEGKFTLRRK